MRNFTQGCSPTGKVVVDDTGAIFAGLPLSLPLPHFTTSSVASEVKDKESKSVLERGLTLERVRIIDPPEEFIKKARFLAKSSGTLNKLSHTDIQIIALALYLHEKENCKVLVATDDYALQYTLVSGEFEIIRIRYKGVKANNRDLERLR